MGCNEGNQNDLIAIVKFIYGNGMIFSLGLSGSISLLVFNIRQKAYKAYSILLLTRCRGSGSGITYERSSKQLKLAHSKKSRPTPD